ncbi:MAG: hypothetical protein MAG794_01530 [Gammaproteobacteria bacterium]|nr:hypothetical protein [Gammaproteobacteria bacterium]
MKEILELGDLERAVYLIFEEKVPFNRLLGVKVDSIEEGCVRMKIEMRDDFVGHFVHRVLHGGVTASVLDVTGGLAAFAGTLEKIKHLPFDEQVQRFNKLGTIDLRVDYLRPGQGQWFVATGYILRIGTKVAVTRMELHNHNNKLIAVGTGAYTVS